MVGVLKISIYSVIIRGLLSAYLKSKMETASAAIPVQIGKKIIKIILVKMKSGYLICLAAATSLNKLDNNQ
jgi:hypothetical protein